MESLRRLGILDTDAEAAYDDLTQLASSIAGTDIALVSLVDTDRQWFKSRVGLDVAETPRDISFCGHAIQNSNETFVVENPATDPRFCDNPLVTDGPVGFYAGVPLRAPDSGLPVGTLCAINRTPMFMSRVQVEQLEMLARQVERLLALRAVNLELEARTADLEHTAESRSRFLASMSHDMRTPINAMQGALELAESEPMPGPIREHLRTLKACTSTLKHLVDDTLDLARIEAGSMELNVAPFNPGHVLESAVRVIRPTLRNRPVELDLTHCLSLPTRLEGDANRIQQVVLNLLGNASKFTGAGQIRIASRYHEGRWVVEVSDTGPGISDEEQALIFEPFVQAASARTTRARGTGLGLSICRELIDLMGGEIRVQSELGRGSTFTIDVPLTPLGEPVSPAFADAANDGPLLPWDILLVEDDALSRKVMAATLAKLGMNVATAPDGQTALQRMRANTFDLVLIDYHLPKMTGPEATSWFRASEAEGQRVPIIGLTASSVPEHIGRCLDSGMDEVLAKPVRRQSFERLIRRLQRHLVPSSDICIDTVAHP